jgi:hypothetical protein
VCFSFAHADEEDGLATEVIEGIEKTTDLFLALLHSVFSVFSVAAFEFICEICVICG